MGNMCFLTTPVDKTWYQELENADTFYTEVTTFKLIESLHKRSGDRHSIGAVDIMYDMHQ